MNDTKGYYSVIQYCPDISRLEAANIGVLLFCPDVGSIRAKTAAANERVAKFFGRDSFDAERLRAAKRAIERRIEIDRDSFRTLEDLIRFINTRGNDILLTPPRPMRVVDVEQDLDALFKELVGGRARREPKQPVIPALDEIFQRPSLQGRVIRDHVVTVPTIGRCLKVRYAYRNGTLNLVKPYRFSALEERATSAAMRFAIEGDLLQRHRENGEERKLIVVSAFDNLSTDASLRRRVDGVLKEYDVRVVHEDAIESFGREVETQAH